MKNEDDIMKMGDDDISAYGGGELSRADELKILLEMSRNNLATVSCINSNVTRNTQRIGELERANDERKQTERISSDQARVIRKLVNERVYKLMGASKRRGRVAAESKRVANVYSPKFHSALWNSLYEEFKVSEYRDLKAVDYDDAVSFVKTWEPDDIDELKSDAELSWSAKNPGMSVNEYLGKLDF